MAAASVPATYKAWIYEQYGNCEDVLQLRTVPTLPLGPTDVRIQVHSAALNPIDYKLAEIYGKQFTGGSPTADKPYRVGLDAAGVVVETGSDVQRVHVGDAVYAMTAAGALAEFFTLDEQFVARKPSSLDFDRAAALPVVSQTSLQAIDDHAKLTRGETILIFGGSTSVGLFAIQYAKHLGATVIATTSTKNAALVKSIGADHVIDYTREKWSQVLFPHSVDVVYDCSVEPTAWDDGAQLVLKKETGRFVTLLPTPNPTPSKFGASFAWIAAHASGELLERVTTLVDEGVVKPFVDSVVPLEKAVDGISRIKTGRAVGKVVVKVVGWSIYK